MLLIDFAKLAVAWVLFHRLVRASEILSFYRLTPNFEVIIKTFLSGFLILLELVSKDNPFVFEKRGRGIKRLVFKPLGQLLQIVRLAKPEQLNVLFGLVDFFSSV